MKWCSNCGAQLEKNEKYCPECGARQELVDYEEKGKKKGKKRATNGASKKGKIIILCIVVIMIVVAVAGVNYLQNQKAKAEARKNLIEFVENADWLYKGEGYSKAYDKYVTYTLQDNKDVVVDDALTEKYDIQLMGFASDSSGNTYVNYDLYDSAYRQVIFKASSTGHSLELLV